MRGRAMLWSVLLLLPLICGGVLTTPVFAGESETEREVQAARKQIAKLFDEAAALKAEGHHDEAAEVYERATAMKRRLHEFLKRQAREKKQGQGRKQRRELSSKQAHAILRGLGQGIEALNALGKKEEAAHLRRIYDGLRKRMAAAAEQPQRKKTERQVVEEWIELMGYAVKILARHDNHDRAEMLEHGKHAFEIALHGKKDERSMRILAEAPSRARMAACLLHAAEILHDQGDKRHAKLMAELGHQWKKQARRGKDRERREREHEGEGLDSLAHRVEIMEIALPALREGERKKAARILERGIRTGRVMLAERRDEEAQEIISDTPQLGHLAEVLHLASDLWAKFGDKKKARLVASLAQHYVERARQTESGERRHDDDDAHEEDHDAHEDHDEDDERAEELEELHEEMEEIRDEMEEMREMLERLQKRLMRLLRDR